MLGGNGIGWVYGQSLISRYQMKNQESRRGRRIRHTQRVIRNRLRFLRVMGPKEWYELHLRNRYRLAKRHPWDCGRGRCHICHSEKLFGRPKAKNVIPKYEYEEIP